MSLREQLLKAGLASENQAKKSARALEKSRHHKKVDARLKGADQSFTEADAFTRRDEEHQKDWEEVQSREREAKFQVEHLQDFLQRTEIKPTNAKQYYYFSKSDGAIESILVNEIQAMHLATGELAIAYFARESRYILIRKENALQVERLHPQSVACLHRNPKS